MAAATAGSAGQGAVSGQAGAAEVQSNGGAGSVEIVNGIVDGGRLFACVSETTGARTLRTELPVPGGGLAFGDTYHLAADWDLSLQAMEVELFMATPAQADGVGCDALRSSATPPFGGAVALDAGGVDGGDAGATPSIPFPVEPTTPRQAGSVTLAPGALRDGGRYVLVSAGCATAGIPRNDAACGEPDNLFGEHRSLVLAELGAEAVEGEANLGLQFLNASRAVARADLILQTTSQRQPVRLATEVQFGALRPRVVATVEEPVGLELHVAGGSASDYTEPWVDTLARVGTAAVQFQRNYLVVYVGPAPDVAPELGFAPPRFVLIAPGE